MMRTHEEGGGRPSGRVMLKNWRTLDAPSRSAASYRLTEMFCKPASSKDGVVADVAPDLDHRAGDQDDLAVGQPADVGAQQLVDDAVLGVEDPLPDHGHGGGGHHHGQEEDGAEGGAPLDLAVQQNGHQQSRKMPTGTVRMQKKMVFQVACQNSGLWNIST